MKFKKFFFSVIITGLIIYLARAAWREINPDSVSNMFDGNTGKEELVPKASPSPSLTPEKPLPRPRQIECPSGWKFDETGTDSAAFDWFKPVTPNTEKTKPFPMEGLITNYELLTDCVLEFRSKTDPNKVTTVWKDSDTNETYLRLNEKEFSDKPMDPKEFKAVRMDAAEVTFGPKAPGETISVRMGRKE